MRISNQSEDTNSEEIVLQKEKPKQFKELNFKGKLHYIWDYYKWYFVFGIVIFTVAAYTIPAMIENHKEAVLYAAFVNSQIYSQETTTLMDDFVEQANIDMDGKRIVLDTSLIIDRDKADQISMQHNQKVLALFSSNTLDVMINDEDNYQFYASQGAFQSLEDVLPKDIFEKYKPYMLTCNSKDSNQTIYYGIKVRTSKVLYEEQAYSNDMGQLMAEPVFSICTNASQPENAVKFLEFLMKEEVEIEDVVNTATGEAVTTEAVEIE